MDPRRHKITTTYDNHYKWVNVHAYDRDTGEMVGRLQGTPNEFSSNQIEWGGPLSSTFDSVGAYHDDSGRPQAQGELFSTRSGEVDMLAVHPKHQGQGIARAMANALGHHIGSGDPSDTLTPDSAGMLSHMGIDHAEPSMLDEEGSKPVRDQWAKDALEVRSLLLGGYYGSAEDERATERDATHLAQITPTALGGHTPSHLQPKQFGQQLPGQRRMF